MKRRSQWVVIAICILSLVGMGCGSGEEAGAEGKMAEEITLHVQKQASAVEQGQEEENGNGETAGQEKAAVGMEGKAEGKQEPEQKKEKETEKETEKKTEKEKASGQEKKTEQETKEVPEEKTTREEEVKAGAVPGGEPEQVQKERENQGSGHMVAIDAGHQARGSSEKEPTGPGSSEMKARVTGGTRGTTTGLYEYELNLMVAQRLKAVLEDRGYQVYMVRESNDVDISNAERAQMAYDSGADIFVRIHANGAENSSANGAMTICPTADNPYVSGLYEESRRLSESVLDGIVESAGCKKERVWETDTMSGINWSSLPVTIVEMGYMTNPEEDTRLSTEAYQQLIAEGIADGIDAYYGAAQ